MISKQTFVDIINELQREQDRQYDLNILCKKHLLQSDSLNCGLFDTVIELLGDIFNNEEMIRCWVYDFNFGKENKHLNADTPELFYDYLTSNKTF